MKILIVDCEPERRDARARLFANEHHDVRQAEDAESAQAQLFAFEPDVAIVGTALHGVCGIELVRSLRAAESSTRVYVVVTSTDAARCRARDAFQAGADDYAGPAVTDEELLARADGINRIRRGGPRMLVESVGTPHETPASLSTWSTIREAVCGDLRDMFSLDFAAVDMNHPLDGAVFAAEIPLSAAEKGYEVRFAVGADDDTLKALMNALFGSPEVDPDAARDMLREIVNVAAGAMKRGAETEGYTFTTGIPADVTPEGFRKSGPAVSRHWIAECGDVRLRFEMESRPRLKEKVLSTDLREGMVLAGDLLDDGGSVLLAVGTRLNEVHITRLAGLLDGQKLVDVARAA